MGDKLYPEAIAALLTVDGQPALDAWYAEPLTRRQAERLAQLARKALQQAYARGGAGYELRILEMVAGFWLDQPVDHLYASLAAVPASQRQKALLELVYGQLLVSRRLDSAQSHLDSGFHLAADLFEPDSYFELMHRHDLLSELQPCSRPVPAQPLPLLLNEAKIIRRIEPRRTRVNHAGRIPDTLG